MSKEIISARENATIKEVASKMLKYDVGFLPITENSKVRGVITDRDIATRIFKNTDSLSTCIKDYMHKNVVSLPKETSLLEALHVMKKEKVKRILVTDQNKVVGIVSLSDIIKNCEDYKKIVEALKEIFAIQRNTDKYETEIDEFYL